MNDLVSQVTIVDRATAVADRVASSLDRMAGSADSVAGSFSRIDTQTTISSRSLAGQAGAFESLKRQADPVYARMQDLANAQAKLNSMVAAGVASQAEASTVYASLKTQADAAVARLNRMGGAHGNLNLRMQEAMHSGRGFIEMVLAGANPLQAFTMEAGRATSILLQMDEGFKGLVMSALPIIAPLALIAGGLAAVAIASSQVHDGQKAVSDALRATGDAAGVSANGVESWAQTVNAAGDVTAKQARAMAASFIQAGVSTKVWTDLAPAVKGFAEVTGGDMAKAQDDLAKAVGGPISAFSELDQKYNLVSDAQLQHIQNLQEQGRVMEAQAEKTAALDQRFGHIAETMSGWQRITQSLSRDLNNFWDALGGGGQANSLDAQLKAAKVHLNYLQTTGGADQYGSSVVSAAQQEYDALAAKKAAEDAKAAAEANALAIQAEGKAAGDLARQYDASGTEAHKIKNDITLLTKAMMDGAIGADAYNKSLAAAQAKLAALQDPIAKDIAALQAHATAAGMTGATKQNYLARRSIYDRTDLSQSEKDRLYSATEQANNADQAAQAAAEAQKQAEAAQKVVQAVTLQADAQDRLTASVGKGWLAQQQADNENQTASAVAQNSAVNQDALRAAYDNLTAAKQRNIDAASGDKLQQELDIAKATTEAHQQGAAAVANLTVQLGHMQDALEGVSPAQQVVNDNLRKQIELQKEQAAAGDYAQNLANETLIAQKQLDILTQTKGVRTQEIDALKSKLDIEKQFPNLSEDERQKLLEQSDNLARIKGQVQDITKAYQEQQREIQQVADQISNAIGNGIATALKGGGDAWTKMLNSWHSMLDNFIGQMIAEFAKTQIIVPIVAEVIGGSSGGGGTSGAAGSSGGFSLSNLFGMARQGASLYQSATGNSLIGQAYEGSWLQSGVNSAYEGSYLQSAYEGSYLQSGVDGASGLFGGGAGAAGAAAGEEAGMSAGGFAYGNAGEQAIAAAAGQAGSGSAGAAGAGAGMMGTASGALAVVGTSYMAGTYIGQAVGSPGGGAAAGAAGGAATGAAVGSVVPVIGTAIGAIIGAIVGAIAGALGGQHPTVGPNATAAINGFVNGTPTWGMTSDNGGDQHPAYNLMQQSVSTLQATVTAMGGTLTDVAHMNMGYFKGKYFVDDTPSGGSAKYDQNQFSDATAAISDFVMRQLKADVKEGYITGLSDDVKTALKNSVATNLTDLAKDLDFAQGFKASINALNGGAIDFTKGAETQALTQAEAYTKQIQDFKAQVTALGLDTQAAADATKNAVEVFLGLKDATPAATSFEQAIETLKGSLDGVKPLLTEVGIDQQTATDAVANKVRVLLGLVDAPAPANPLDQQIAAIQNSFKNLGPTLTALGITADETTKALNKAISDAKAAAAAADQAAVNAAQGNDFLNQIQAVLTNLSGGSIDQTVASAQETGLLNGLTPDQIGLAVQQFGDASKVGADAAKSFLSLANSVVASKIAAEQNSQALQTANSNLQFFTNAAKSLGDYAASLTTDSSLSPLSPLDQYNTAKAQFTADQALAQTGNQDAIGRLQNDAKAFLDASKAYNASNAQYAADFQLVQHGITQAASYAQDQISVEQKIVDTLNTPVLDQLKAIVAAINALAVKNSGAGSTGFSSTGSYGGLGSFGSGVSTSIGGSTTGLIDPFTLQSVNSAIAGYYQNDLGRTPSSSETSYYANLYANGTSMAQIGNYITNSPEYLASHSHANGGIASGWSLVGERGPELVNFTNPGRVYTADQTRAAFAGNDNSALIAKLGELQAQVAQLQQALVSVTAQSGMTVAGAVKEQTGYVKQSASAAARASADPRIRAA